MVIEKFLSALLDQMRKLLIDFLTQILPKVFRWFFPSKRVEIFDPNHRQDLPMLMFDVVGLRGSERLLVRNLSAYTAVNIELKCRGQKNRCKSKRIKRIDPNGEVSLGSIAMWSSLHIEGGWANLGGMGFTLISSSCPNLSSYQPFSFFFITHREIGGGAMVPELSEASVIIPRAPRSNFVMSGSRYFPF